MHSSVHSLHFSFRFPVILDAGFEVNQTTSSLNTQGVEYVAGANVLLGYQSYDVTHLCSYVNTRKFIN
jgi:hypothetical protein